MTVTDTDIEREGERVEGPIAPESLPIALTHSAIERQAEEREPETTECVETNEDWAVLSV